MARQYGTGGLYQRHDHPACPEPVEVTGDDGKVRKVRPKHTCKGRWVGSIEAGWTSKNDRRRLVVTAKTRTEAKRKLEQKQRQVAREGMPATTREPTVAEWAATWLEMTSHTLRPKPWRTNRSSINKWVVPIVGRERLSRLGPRHVRNVMDEMRPKTKASTMVRTHSTFLTMLRAAVAEGYTVPPAVLAHKPPTANESDRDAIPIDDVYALLKVAGKRPDGSRWLAAIANGMRKNECLGLTWPLVDLDKGLVNVSWQLQVLPYVDRKNKHLGFRVPDGFEARQLKAAWHLTRPKTEKGERILVLIPPMVDALREWQKVAPKSDHDLVWPRADGRPQDEKADTAAWHALQTEAKVSKNGEPYELHEARHTTATLLMEEGIDPEIIKAILGHVSIRTSRGYMHVKELAKRQAAEAIGRRLRLTSGG